MIEPTLALQTAIRAALIGAVPVPADHIRSGSTRPDVKPCIIMSNGATTLHGHNYRSQRLAEVFLDLHVWTEGEEEAKALTFAVQTALDTALVIDGASVEHFEVTRTIFPRDPDPTFGHGILSVEALLRWAI